MQHHLDSVNDYITLTPRFISINFKSLNIFFRFSPLRMYSYKDKLERGGLRVGKWGKTGGRGEWRKVR